MEIMEMVAVDDSPLFSDKHLSELLGIVGDYLEECGGPGLAELRWLSEQLNNGARIMLPPISPGHLLTVGPNGKMRLVQQGDTVHAIALSYAAPDGKIAVRIQYP